MIRRILHISTNTICWIREYGLVAFLQKFYALLRSGMILRKLREIEPASPEASKSLSALYDKIEECGGYVLNRRASEEPEKKQKVLLLSHELNYTGAPIALGHLAIGLKQMGLVPVYISPNDGGYARELGQYGITVGFYPRLMVDKLAIIDFDLFAMIIINTVALATLVNDVNELQIPVVWWVHESRSFYSSIDLSQLPDKLGKNVHVYCVGEYALDALSCHRPNYKLNTLLYSVPDFIKDKVFPPFELPARQQGQKIVLVVGTIEPRKGYGVAIKAFEALDKDVFQGLYFVFVGKNCYMHDYLIAQQFVKLNSENAIYFETLTRDEMRGLYGISDYLICSSLDDPMPIVVAEAMQMSLFVICSEHTGYRKLLPKYDAGLIYREDNPIELARCLEWAYLNPNRAKCIRENARQFYERCFSESVFEENLRRTICSLIYVLPDTYSAYNGLISVVIPVFNGLNDLKRLIPSLKQQELVNLQIVAVDSGSTDGSKEFLESSGVDLICIQHGLFSHSTARNLGFAHANGEFVLFMTQDAMPTDVLWVRKFIDPLLENKDIVASSCKEIPRNDCDCYGAYKNFEHACYMGILNRDRVVNIHGSAEYDRRDTGLNDVACLVRSDVFSKYLYRGSYAEDLDLGLRLLRDGHKIIFRSSVRVIHSHNRPAIYHFKRSLIDSVTLQRMFPGTGQSLGAKDSAVVVSAILTAFGYISELLGFLAKKQPLILLDLFTTMNHAQLRAKKKIRRQKIDLQKNRLKNKARMDRDSYYDILAALVDSADVCTEKNFKLIPVIDSQVNSFILFFLGWKINRTADCLDYIELFLTKLFASLSGQMVGEFVDTCSESNANFSRKVQKVYSDASESI